MKICANAQALCLTKELNCKSSEIYVGLWKRNLLNFNFKFLEFFAQKFFGFHEFVDNYFLKLKVNSNQSF